MKSLFKKNNILLLAVLFIVTPIFLINPLETNAAGTLQKLGTEPNGIEIWQTSGASSATDPIRIPAGSYGNGITASLISLVITSGSYVKINGPHTFYNLTIATGATLSTDPLSDGRNFPAYPAWAPPYFTNSLYGASPTLSLAASNTYPINAAPVNPDYVKDANYSLTANGINKKINITVIGKLIVNGTITTDGLGYKGGYGPPLWFPYYLSGPSASSRNEPLWDRFIALGITRGAGIGGGPDMINTANAHNVGAGGSYGGLGAVGYLDSDQVSYYCNNGTIPDSWPKPTTTYGTIGEFGSGGGYANYSFLSYPAHGGSGGGSIKLQGNEIEMGSNGKITANGAIGSTGPGGGETVGGSGSGGSIEILFNQGNVKKATANAGTGGCGNKVLAGNGVVTVDPLSSLEVENTSVAITANGGAAGANGIWSGAGGGGRIHIGSLPTLTSDLKANPSTGANPLNTRLTATAGGNATGTVNYSFWWNCSNASTIFAEAKAACGDPTNASIGAKFDGVNAASKYVDHTYSSENTFSPKVIIERDIAFPAESRSAVVVTSSKPLVCAKYGDVNDDGKIGQPDTTMITNFLTGTALTDEQKRRADVDNSGTVTAADRQLIFDYLNGTANSFPVCSFSASLVAKPSSGFAPLGVELQGTAGNVSPTANLTYYFWWNCNNSSTNYSEVVNACQAPSTEGNQYGKKIENINGTAVLQKVSHQYDAVGTYKPKLLIVRDGVMSAQSNAAVTSTQKPAPPVDNGGTVIFEGGNTAQAITIRGSLVSDKIEFNPRLKNGLGIKSRFSISVYNDATVLNAHLPIFDGIMDVVVK